MYTLQQSSHQAVNEVRADLGSLGPSLRSVGRVKLGVLVAAILPDKPRPTLANVSEYLIRVLPAVSVFLRGYTTRLVSRAASVFRKGGKIRRKKSGTITPWLIPATTDHNDRKTAKRPRGPTLEREIPIIPR